MPFKDVIFGVKITILQKLVLRLIHFTDRKEHAIPLFIIDNILPLNFLYYESVCNLMHGVSNNVEPTNIMNLFSKTSNIHSYRTRSSTSENFYIKRTRLEVQKDAFSRVGAKIWNEIPNSLKKLPKKEFNSKKSSKRCWLTFSKPKKRILQHPR